MESPPPRPPKKPHLQSRKLSPESLERIQIRQNGNQRLVKFKPPAPDPNPSPPDLQVTNEWIKHLRSSALDSSDSGCSSFGSTTTSPMNSAVYRPEFDIPLCSPPDLLLSNQSKTSNEMVAHIEQKLINYNAQKLEIEEAIRKNDSVGQGIASLVETRATPREISKFKFHVEDTEKITNLLVSLSGRLARTESSLAQNNPKEDESNLIAKRDKLQDQLNEAKMLQENIEKRSTVVSNFLQKYFSPSEFQDFSAFLEQKSKLIMESRELSDKISLSEEQMRVLTKRM